MGAPMGRNLLKAGHQVTVWNRTRERARADGRALTVRRDTWPEQIHRDRPSMIADAFHAVTGNSSNPLREKLTLWKNQNQVSAEQRYPQAETTRQCQ